MKNDLHLVIVHRSLFLCVSLLVVNLCKADVTTSGEVAPDPITSTPSDRLVIGDSLFGRMVIDGGSVVQSEFGTVGAQPGSAGNVTIDGVGSSWFSNMLIGIRGNGQVDVVRGGNISSNGPPFSTLGRFPGSSGVVTINDPGSSWTTSRLITVGDEGEGILRIEGGGLVDALAVEVARNNQRNSYIELDNGTLTASTLIAAHANLRGTGTINTMGWLFNQTLSVQDLADLPTSFALADESSQNIAINIDWSDPTILGADGHGSLTFSTGEEIVSRIGGYIGFSPGSNSSVTVDGDGSSWRVGSQSFFSAPLRVGNWGEGTLNILDGASVLGPSTIVGYEPGSTGTVTVDGEGASLQSYELNIGWEGDGTLNVTNGGQVSTGGFSIVGFDSTGHVLVDGVGSEWRSTGSRGGVSIGGHLGTGGMARLEIIDGGRAAHKYAVIGSGASGHGVITVYGVDSRWEIVDSLLLGQFGGIGELHIGDGGRVVSGSLVVDSSSHLQLTLASTSDQFINVAGPATIDGMIGIHLAAGFQPIEGDIFRPIAADEFSGAPSFDFSDATLADGLAWDVTDFLADGTISVVAVPEPVGAALVSVGGVLLVVIRTRRGRPRTSGHRNGFVELC